MPTIDMELKVVAISLGLTLGVCLGQNAFGQPDSTVDLRIPVDVVLVPVTVEDPNGKLIHSLQKNDFEVSEDGIVQNLTYFSVGPSPLSVAVLLDRTIDAHAQDSFKQNMLALVEAFSGFDEMACYEFLSLTNKLQDFTFEKEKLLKTMSKVEFAPVLLPGLSPLMPVVNTSDLDNAIRTAAYDLQRRARNRRKVIFVVCNGVVSFSDRHDYPETKKLLLENGIVVYGIGQGNSFLFRKVDPIKKYAGPTGGEIFYPWKTRAFAETYQRISEAARNQYVLGYTPQTRVQEETYRKITVRLTSEHHPVGHVRHRGGYYAIPQTPQSPGDQVPNAQ
jgi:Ca-activated chloride channel family protein